MVISNIAVQPGLRSREPLVRKRGADLLDKIWSVVSATKKVHPLIESITHMTQNALSTAASSLLLIDEDSEVLCFKYADGPVGKQLRRIKMTKQAGIVGWVASNGRPLIVNDVRQSRYFDKSVDEITGFQTRSILAAPLLTQGRVIGVIEVLNKLDGSNFDKNDLIALTRVASTAAVAIENLRLNERLLDSYKSTVRAFVSLADSKETCAKGHSRRVAAYALMGAQELALPDKEIQAIEYAALLHDIGKLSIPDSILNKPAPLSEREWDMIKQHPLIGANLLKGIPVLKEASLLVLSHHERYDGTGYPQGLKAEVIPMGARLLAVVDSFDHMTTEHSYRTARSKDFAFIELKKCVQKQFCPVALKAFCSGFIRSRLLMGKD
jgi:HD-GYP domain-containing protein (c-di-GMP phosphodiesterase class II)